MNAPSRPPLALALAAGLLAAACSSGPPPASAEASDLKGGKVVRTDAPGISVGQPTPTRVEVVVCGGLQTGAPAGFSLQWVGGEAATADWDAAGTCEASFSGSASGSRYALGPGQCVTVDVGELLLDAGASTSCGQPLKCGSSYAFRAFAHATPTMFRSTFGETTGITLPCAAAYSYQGTFTPTGSRVALRAFPVAVGLADGRVLVAGGMGCGPVGAACDDAEVYDPASGTFTPTGRLVTPRRLFTATLLKDGRVLVLGGADQFGPLASAELYDPATGVFTPAGDMGTPRSDHTATLLEDGRVLVAGSIDYSTVPRTAVGSAEIFDPATGRFTPTGSLVAARYYHTATLLPDGRVLLVGGTARGVPLRTADALPLASAELYDPGTGTFSATASLGVARCFHTATLLPGGKVLVAGGFAGPGAELYDPGTGAFAPAGSMGAERFSHTATLLLDGTVLLAGGNDHALVATASAERYDPATGTFTPTGSMNASRTSHEAVPLPEGPVLMVGGNVAPPDAELYR